MDVLLRQARDGSEDARERLAGLLGHEVRRAVERQAGAGVRRHVSVADLVQETLVRLFRSLDRLPEDTTLEMFRARIGRTARWVVVDAARSLRHQRGESVAGAGSPAAVADPGSDGSSGDVTRDDQAAWLRRLVGRLDASYAEVVMARLDGQSFAEIAERLGASEATVRKRYQRAYRSLKDLVDLATGCDSPA